MTSPPTNTTTFIPSRTLFSPTNTTTTDSIDAPSVSLDKNSQVQHITSVPSSVHDNAAAAADAATSSSYKSIEQQGLESFFSSSINVDDTTSISEDTKIIVPSVSSPLPTFAPLSAHDAHEEVLNAGPMTFDRRQKRNENFSLQTSDSSAVEGDLTSLVSSQQAMSSGPSKWGGRSPHTSLKSPSHLTNSNLATTFAHNVPSLPSSSSAFERNRPSSSNFESDGQRSRSASRGEPSDVHIRTNGLPADESFAAPLRKSNAYESFAHHPHGVASSTAHSSGAVRPVSGSRPPSSSVDIPSGDDGGDDDSRDERAKSSGETDDPPSSSGETGTGPSTRPRWAASSAAASGSGATTASAGTETKESSARRQNSACDACRNRKVRCMRQPGEDKCNHCKAKGIDCTTIYVQLASSGAKRPVKRIRSEGVGELDQHMSVMDDTPGVLRYLLLRDIDYTDSYEAFGGKRMGPTSPAEARLANASARHEFVSSLLETYFSTVHIRYPVIDPQEFLQRFHYHSPELGGPPPVILTAVLLAWGAKFSNHPIIVADRRDTASEELTPSQRLKRSVVNPHATTSRRPPSSAESTSNRVMGRSRIAEDLIIKAQEVLDRNKAHRIAKMDNVKAAIIIQALFWQQSSQAVLEDVTSPSQMRTRKRRGVYICNGFWIASAISQMFEMKVHLKETVDRIADPSTRAQVAMAWWLACMFDAHMSAFYRRKPLVSAEDFSTPPPMPPSAGPEAGPSPVASEQGYRIWLNSAMDQCEMMRAVYFALWTPIAQSEGISARKLEKLVSMAYTWRSNHLALVGAPDPDWPSSWRFADAITACSSDINYQIIWILMWQAVDEFGIAELKSTNLSSYNMASIRHGFQSNLPSSVAEMELDRSKIRGMSDAIYEEALKASLRCADLARMLCDFDYLQNEAGIMKFSLGEAGYCLTRFRRPEVFKIIDGLRQYGQAFEECYEQADELERLASEYANVGNTRFGAPQPPSFGSGMQGFSGSGIEGGAPISRESGSGGGGHNILPAIGSGMMANLGYDVSQAHPGAHQFAHHLMQHVSELPAGQGQSNQAPMPARPMSASSHFGGIGQQPQQQQQLQAQGYHISGMPGGGMGPSSSSSIYTRPSTAYGSGSSQRQHNNHPHSSGQQW